MGALENTMRCTVRKEIQEAVAAYEDKPRDQWLFDYPAQVCKDQKRTHNENNLKGLLLQRAHEIYCFYCAPHPLLLFKYVN